MNQQLHLKASLIACAVLAFSVAQAQHLPKTDYQAGKTTISAAYNADKAACAPMKGNANDICVQEAKGREKIARAELEYSYTGKPADQTKVLTTKAESTYAVAREKCDEQAGNAKDVCVQEAKAVEVKALADARLGKQIGEAKNAAEKEKLAADYKVAVEKCDAMAGDTKAKCIATAKARFGQG